MLALSHMALAFGQATAPSYTLQPGDKIEVSVWGEEQLQREVMIRPDGKFSFPLTGEVNAIGRTVADVQQEMTTKLVTYIPEAVVTVSVTGLAGNRVYVIGQVAKPGTYDMNPRINVLQALSLAGGTTPFAALNDIIIIRGNGRDQRVLRFAYDDIKRGRNLEQNIELDNGDVVIVP
jgi:polysaccharide export outer membrane protein